MDLPAANEPSTKEIENQLALILGSRHFRQARSLEKFLNFVVTCSLTGEIDRLKELSLGIEVFQRPPDFDPRIDNVVRVQAANLRKKLTEYYQDEGIDDPLLIDLPKGHYVPTFSYRSPRPAIAALTGATPPAPRPWIRQAGRVLRAWPIPLSALMGFMLALGYSRWKEPVMSPSPSMPARRVEYSRLPIWDKFLVPEANNLLAYGTPQFFASDGIYIRDVLVNSPEDLSSTAGARLTGLTRSLGITLRPTEIYTGVGEAHGISTVSRFFWENSIKLNIARSRVVGWQDLKNTNLIFLSSLRFHTLMDELGYPSDFSIHRDKSLARIINERPGPGEETSYGMPGEYAVISLWPGKSDSRRILQLSGVTTWATLAAAEYVTDPDSLRLLDEQFEECRRRLGTASHPPYFQILVSAEVKDNIPIAVRYVTHHDLEIPAKMATQ